MKKCFTVNLIIALICFTISMPVQAIEEDVNLLENTISAETDTVQSIDERVDSLETKEKETEESINIKKEKLEYIESVLPEVMIEIQALNENIEEYEKTIEELSQQTNSLEDEIQRLEQQIQYANEKYENQKELLEKRLIIMYETGETTYLDVLLQSTSLSDFLSTYYMMSEIADADFEMLAEINSEMELIANTKEEIERQQELYINTKDDKEKTTIVLENTKIIKNSYMNQLTEEQLQLQKDIEEYYKTVGDIEAEIKFLTTENVGTEYVGGSMGWPVPGYSRITSSFGMRTHPITGVYALHTGTDISAPIGANFVAANKGIVIKAGYNYAYGNMVIIDHGGGVSTLYAHGSEILVTVGQTVEKGDLVLKIGSTGYSTGPHAHFAIKINGEYIDPMNFIKPL